jgi:class 3 adenylate cyclase
MSPNSFEDEKFTILYIDDEYQNLVSFKATFRRNYHIETAQSAAEAHQLLHDKDIDLIIADQRMPEMTGVQFFERIIPEFPDIIRIILTGYADVEAIVHAINKGSIFRYITKPWDENDLRMTIENARQIYLLQKHNRVLFEQLQQKVAEQERTLRLFMKYVPQHVVEKTLSNHSSDLFLEGEQRYMTVLFCDIRGFTQMSEEFSPKEVVSFLNHYYSVMTGVIKKHKGTVNQFVGDEIFSVFGVPLADPTPEANAIFCALEMLEKVKTIASDLGRNLVIGLGINSGEAVMGNLGSEDKISFSITGDTVNTGKRIEMLTKEYPNTALVSESVYLKTNDLFEFQAWEPLHVKGKRDKIRVYQVIRRK